MKKPFYQRKRFWLPLLILLLISLPFLINPIKSFRATTTFVLKVMGIEVKHLQAKGYKVRYYEGGKEHPHTVILLHGFGGNALFTWMRLMPSLTKQYHVIAPDLLASNFLQLNPKTYSIDSEVKLVLALMKQIKTEKPTLLGLSVGGWISLIIAHEHPEKVNSLILAESAGLTTKVPELAKLTLTDRDKAKKFMKLLFHNPPPLPNFVLDALVRSSKKIKKNYEAIFAGFIKNSQGRVLDGKLNNILHRTLILHGRQDQVIDLEHAQRLNAGLPNSQLVILENSGHAVVWDSHRKLKEEILKFLE